MKRIVIGSIVLMSVINPVCAAPMGKIEMCTMISGLAKTAMEKRQSGTLLSEILVALDKVQDNPFTTMAKAITIMAYEKPRYSTPDYINKSVIDFTNESMSLCLATMK